MPLHRIVCGFDQKIDPELRLDDLAFRVCRFALVSARALYDALQVRRFRFGYVQSNMRSDLDRTLGVIFVDHPGSCPNRPIRIPRKALVVGAYEMKTVDHLSNVGVVKDLWPFGPERTPPGQINVTQINSLLRFTFCGVLAKGLYLINRESCDFSQPSIPMLSHPG
jgi:hypothetical protein